MTRAFRLHDLHIHTTSDHSAADAMLARTLRYKGATPVNAFPPADLTLDFRTNRPPAPLPEDARHLGDSEHGDIGVWMTADSMMLRCGAATVVLRPDAGTATAALTPELLTPPADARRNPLFYLITFSLVILLRYRGWFALHTAALALDGRGLLLVAESDSGKSTATLNLVRQGWRYLSDDTVLLRAANEGVHAFSFRRNFCVDPDATAHFPELDGPDWPASLSDASKWQIDMERLYPGQFAPTCMPRALVLPEIADAPTSRVEPVDAKVALARLIDQGALFLTPDPALANRHLEVFRRLIRQTRAVRLRAGRDVLERPRRLHGLLAPLLRADRSAS